MKIVRNITDAPLHVPGYPEFAPREQREVSDADAAYLLGSSNIAIVASTKQLPSVEPTKSPRKKTLPE